MSDIAIHVNQLSKRFNLATDRRTSLKERIVRGSSGRHNDFWALREVDFEVERGTTFGLVGHNGSGKSTLLKILAGIYRPTSGSVSADGRISALLELGAGFHGELSGRENVYLNGAILGMTRKQIDASMDRIIDFSGIEAFIDSPVKVYSSGMYVRLGFSIAVTLDPEILIVDEIIAVGDEEFQRKCFDYLYELRKRGTTIALVTHSLGLVQELCDRAVWLDHGRMRSTGDSTEVVNDYLREVNRQEAESEGPQEEQAAAGDQPKLQRRGSGAVRVDALEFLDADGNSGEFLTVGEPCRVRIRYTASEPIPSASFALGFWHESGAYIAEPHSSHQGVVYALQPGPGSVEYAIDRLPMRPGPYLVSTSVGDRGHVYDAVDRGYEIKIRSRSVTDDPGLVQMYGAWSTTPTREGVEMGTPSND